MANPVDQDIVAIHLANLISHDIVATPKDYAVLRGPQTVPVVDQLACTVSGNVDGIRRFNGAAFHERDVIFNCAARSSS